LFAQERAAALQEALAISKLRQEQQRQLQTTDNKIMSEDEYTDLLQHLKDSDAQYTELTLQEVIYQLAKLLFSQNLISGKYKNFSQLGFFSGAIYKKYVILNVNLML